MYEEDAIVPQAWHDLGTKMNPLQEKLTIRVTSNGLVFNKCLFLDTFMSRGALGMLCCAWCAGQIHLIWR